MTKEQIIEVLNHWNFWNRDIDVGLFRFEYLHKLLEFLETDKIISIVGVRRSGKSTLIRQMARTLVERGVERERILIINFEEPSFEGTDLNFLLLLKNLLLYLHNDFSSSKFLLMDFLPVLLLTLKQLCF
ncbi:MAG TPA: hypothetical protein ENL38_01455, partial [Candidatus Aminicenantes bacterium]|nr:hypothetical protein [Candidatus Aminicenantes bacterium]